jgi:hypothetical protein
MLHRYARGEVANTLEEARNQNQNQDNDNNNNTDISEVEETEEISIRHCISLVLTSLIY